MKNRFEPLTQAKLDRYDHISPAADKVMAPYLAKSQRIHPRAYLIGMLSILGRAHGAEIWMYYPRPAKTLIRWIDRLLRQGIVRWSADRKIVSNWIVVYEGPVLELSGEAP